MIKRVFLIYIISFLTYGASAFTTEVCHTCEVNNLADAIRLSHRGDTVLVKPGIYECSDQELRKPITLIGEKGAILDGQMTGYILKILSDSVTIRGFKFINSGKSYTKDYAAIYSYRVRHFNIIGNEIENPFFGALLEKSHDGVIKDNLIFGESKQEDDSGNGIHAWHCSNLLISNNTLHGLRDGIYLEFVTESEISNNLSHDNIRYGLHFMFSNNDKYLSNTFQDNGAGVAVMFSKFIVMKENKFIENWGTASYGLLLKEINDAEVENNTFRENTIGVFVEGSNRVNYVDNRFESNGWAVKVSGGCYENYFMRNNFISNSFDLAYNGKLNDNKFEGNFWSTYSGYDLDKNGIGDVPYRPVKLFSYVVNKTPEAIILLRSLFVDIINFSEQVSPVFTPDNLVDPQPSMKPF
ncbi:MAG: nitrous oxide reductase family maturation protein NosD [Cytophagales bacterium]|nr:nitrous oxide reductase family maturation protein NosD [Cytophagales bacterium]